MNTILFQECQVMLAELLLSEKDAIRVWLRTEMDRAVDPMFDSLFRRLNNKLANGIEQTQSTGGAQVENHDDQLEPSHGQTHQPSTSSHLIPPHQNVHYSYQQPNDSIQCNDNFNQQSEIISFAQTTMFPNSQVNFDVLSNEPTDQTQHSTSLPVAIGNDQSNPSLNEQNLNDEDAGDCYCDECLGVIEIDNEVEEDDDESDSVQCIEDEQELSPPEKKPRIDSTQPNNSQPGVAGASQRQPTEDVQPNQVIDHDKHYITVHLRCPESECPDTFTEIELNSHMMERHLIGSNRCLVKDCKQSFDNHNFLGEHIKQVHQHTTQWHCGKCFKHFAKYQFLYYHNYNYHQLGHFQCSFRSCTFTGEYKQKMFTHYKNVHKENPELVCQQSGCSYRTNRPNIFKVHERVHLGIKPFRCKWPNCDFSNASQDYTVKHIKTHFNPKTSSSDVALSGKPTDYLEVVHSLL